MMTFINFLLKYKYVLSLYDKFSILILISFHINKKKRITSRRVEIIVYDENLVEVKVPDIIHLCMLLTFYYWNDIIPY